VPATSQATSAVTATPTFLVSFASGSIPSNVDSIVNSAGGTIAARYTNLGLVLATSSSSSFATSLRANTAIDSVGLSTIVSSKIEIVKSQTAPKPLGKQKTPGSDPLSFRQWDMDQIHAPQARAINPGSSSVLVGVIDSGIDITHPELAGQVNTAASASCIGGVPNTDPAVWANDVIGHGTHVSGIIAAKQNGVGIVGVAPATKVAGVKVAVDDVNDPNFGLVFADAMVCAIDWAIGHNFDVMNASLTIDPFTAPIDDIFCNNEPDRAAIVKMVRQAVQLAASHQVTLVAAAGNMFLDLASLKGQSPAGTNCKVLPVQLPLVIGVSSVGYTQKLSWFSDYGLNIVDLAGPGGDNLIPDPLVTDTTASGQVLSSVPAGSLYYQFAADWNGQVQDCSLGNNKCVTYAYLQGTSQATPHVTGVAALAIARYGKMSPNNLLSKLSLAANPLACPPSPYDPGMTGQPATCTGPTNNTNFYGAGEVDALNVVK
jgi:subtilisin family serine protease